MTTWIGTDANESMAGTGIGDSLDGAGGSDTLTGLGGNDTLLGGLDNDDLDGGADDNSVNGGEGNDTLKGDAGNDTLNGVDNGYTDDLYGGAGDDTYVVDEWDSINEAEDGGVDEMQTAASYAYLRDNVENLTGIGVDQYLSGADLNNSIQAGGGDDTLNGWDGDDTMAGGDGDDRYEIFESRGEPARVTLDDDDAGDDVIIESDDGGEDTIVTNLGYLVMADNVERIETYDGGKRKMIAAGLDGSPSDEVNHHFVGNDSSNTMIGGSRGDTLDGSLGDDSLVGGLGSDTYVLDSDGDVVVEDSDSGIDTVMTDLASYWLGDNIENLQSTLVDTGGTDSRLKAGGQHLVGNYLSNVISGGDGADTLDGGGDQFKLSARFFEAGDTLVGGRGGDSYEIHHRGVMVYEDWDGDGVDVIRTSLRTFQNFDSVERLVFEGKGAFTAVGADTGESIIGGRGSDVMQGEEGEDYLAGMDGRDRLDGGRDQDYLRGGLGSDTLDGGDGVDTLNGGAGNDVFLFDEDDSGHVPGPAHGKLFVVRDLIVDLQDGDRIDLSAVDADINTDGDQDFVRVAAFSGHAGEMRLTYLAGRDVTILGCDTDGDSHADRSIVIDGDHASFDNFVL